MEYEKIKEIMKDMESSKLEELEITFPDGTQIRMKKSGNYESQSVTPVILKADTPIATKSENLESAEVNAKYITSPMVGTFYLKPSPSSEPYVKVGQEIDKGSIVCIIEAMKLMNEIESDYSGKIVEVLVKDGEPVEYGTKLFKMI